MAAHEYDPDDNFDQAFHAQAGIDDDDALEARYGARVPVLRDSADGRELDWPFDPEALHAWLAATGDDRKPL